VGDSVFHNIRKRAFTLLELLIVVAILSLFAGVAGFNGISWLHKQEFQAEKDKVRDRLQAARNVSVIFNSDVVATFKRDPLKRNQIIFKLESEKLLPSPLGSILEEPITLKAVDSVSLDNRETTDYLDFITIKFYGKSHTTSHGEVLLTARGIKEIIELPYDFSYRQESELLYPKEIREDWKTKSLPQTKEAPISPT
jgi:prepilin-type N-terminal cleavage/methylation domain-containing protein